jgi:hypothetical protein
LATLTFINWDTYCKATATGKTLGRAVAAVLAWMSIEAIEKRI